MHVLMVICQVVLQQPSAYGDGVVASTSHDETVKESDDNCISEGTCILVMLIY